MKRKTPNKKFHYIYKITRFDGKYYIGMHSTDDLDDNYFGSGQRLWKSIKYHGKDKHTKDILEFLDSRENLVRRENELVNSDILKDPLCLNLRVGGGYTVRAPEHANAKENRRNGVLSFYADKIRSANARKKISEAHTGRKASEALRTKLKIVAKKRMKKLTADTDKWNKLKQNNREKHLGKKQTKETIDKRIASISKTIKTVGRKPMSREARNNISKSLIGSSRNVKKWTLVSINGEEFQILNLSKWLRENNLKAPSKTIVRDMENNKIYTIKRNTDKFKI